MRYEQKNHHKLRLNHIALLHYLRATRGVTCHTGSHSVTCNREADDMYHAIVPWDLTLCTTAREGQGMAAC